MRTWFYKLIHWEFWSMYIIYSPTFFLWIWFVIKFKSFSFYKYSNPSIKNGGLYGDSKFDIYNLLPLGSFPKTTFIQKNSSVDLKKIISENDYKFPLIVKPNIGCRGIGVEKIFSLNDLIRYNNIINKDFLIQELIEYPNEIGLFYCRMPNENKGKITGITLKKFLTIVGNGIDSMEDILNKSPRFKMQISNLKNKINIKEVLPNGKSVCLVPFGNHNRGTEFFNGNKHITDKLEQTFNVFFNQIEGFYYGRLDIRFNSFEELARGEKFSIIELNGAKSEPTHIYDSTHSFINGQIEIFRHQLLFMKIIGLNLKKKHFF